MTTKVLLLNVTVPAVIVQAVFSAANAVRADVTASTASPVFSPSTDRTMLAVPLLELVTDREMLLTVISSSETCEDRVV